MIRSTFLVAVFLLVSSLIYGQTGSIRGFIYDKSNGEPIIFCNIFLKGTQYGAATDVNGYYNISKIKPGTYTLIVRYLGYDSLTVTVSVKANEIVNKNLNIKQSAVVLGDIDVTAERQDKIEQVRMSLIKVNPKQIKQIPSIGSEPDFAQYLQVLPGVIFTGDQGGQLYIRGGSAIQNKVLLDGMVIYNPFHSIGFFSVFDADLIRNADVYTGGFNAEYGGRISSIMDITMKDGNRTRFGGKVSLSTFGSKLMMEGPLFKSPDSDKSKVSYVFSGKRSYLSESSKILYTYVDSAGLPFDFTDLYGKISIAGDNGSKVNFFGFRYYDKVKYKSLSNLDWNSYGLGSNILLVPSGSAALVKFNFSYSRYEITLNEEEQDPRNSLINGFNVGLTFVYFYGKNELDYGLETNGFKTDFNFYNSVGRHIEQEQNTTELAGFIKYKINIDSVLLIEPGLRIQYYASLGAASPEPRIGLKVNALDWLRFKAAAGIYSQNLISATSDRDVVNLFYGFLSGPEVGDLQDEFDGNEVKNSLQKSWHTILGTEIDLSRRFDLNIEAYYKRNTQLTELNRNKIYDDNGDNYDKPDYQKKDFIIESGNAYGIDFTLKYEFKRTYLWAVYSLGYITRFDGFEEYRPHYDRRHNINLVFSQTFGKGLDWEFGARWNYGSGFPFSQTAGYYEKLPFTSGLSTNVTSANGELGIIYGDLNQGKLPDYHRLDVTLKKRFELAKNSLLEATLSITNVYNRDNIFYFDRIQHSRVDQLPIIPSLGMTLTF